MGREITLSRPISYRHSAMPKKLCSLEEGFGKYHRVLSRAVWSSRLVARKLLMHLVGTFAGSGVVVMGIDDTIEHRKGKHIKAKGIYRDPVRSSDSQVVRVSGLRWLSLMLLVEIGWAHITQSSYFQDVQRELSQVNLDEFWS